MQVHHFLENAAANFPDKNAIWDRGRWYDYSETNKASDRIAVYLLHTGIKRGDRVALLLNNSFEYIASYFGILKAGAAVVGINTGTTAEETGFLLSDSDARCLITSRKHRRNFLPVLTGQTTKISNVLLTEIDAENEPIPGIITDSFYDLQAESSSELPVRTIDVDLAEIVYTSGSTNRPKGVMLTHLNLVSNTQSICRYLRLTQNDRIMVILPFFYIYGKSLLLTHFFMAGSLVIENQFIYPNKVLEIMKSTEATGFAGVPSTFQILLNRSSLGQVHLPNLRYVTQAGGSMAPSVQKQTVKAFSPAKLYIMYGTTEAAPRLSYLDPEFLPYKWGSIGVPVDNVDLLVCDSQGRELPRGKEGEIVARGSNIMKGYWKAPVETEKVLRDGLYFTGDLGRQDEDGFFYITGRTRDIIKVKGYRISTKEIEEVLLENENIHEAAVVGIKEALTGESILAFIVPKTQGWHDEKLIRNYLLEKLSPAKQPRYVIFRNSLPKNESGKIQKRILEQDFIHNHKGGS